MAQATRPYTPGNLSPDTWVNDLVYYASEIVPLLSGPQPTYNVYANPGLSPDGTPREAQIGALNTQGQAQGAGVSPLIIGAAAAGTLLVGIVLVKVLD